MSSRRNRGTRVRTRVRARRFALTLNNPTAAECLKWNSVILDGNVAEHAEDLTFFIVQTEKGTGAVGDSPLGTVHYQAYCEFKKPTSWSTVKGIFGDRIHIETARANSASNIRYCTKNTTRFTGGDICISGQWGTAKRSGGVVQAAIAVINGDKLPEIVDKFPGICLQNMEKVERFIAYNKGVRKEKPKVIILYGLTASGKSQYVINHYGYDDVYWVAPPANGTVWWGHYMCEEVCVFDDFHEDWFSLMELMRILDSTPMLVAPKGGQVPFNSKTLIFTSNVDPRDWYSAYMNNTRHKQEHKDALERRIRDFAEIYDCKKVTSLDNDLEEVIEYRREKREGRFTFRGDFGLNFNTDLSLPDPELDGYSL